MSEGRFLKRIVRLCLTFIILFTVVSMYMNYMIQVELSPTLTTCVYSFFGTELVSAAIIRIMEILRQKDEEKAKKREEKKEAKVKKPDPEN